ncbi:MAG: hypothetical protein IKB16_08680 [Lentisphaeria bacterium]|nr:hypothetical protein [Lentisphaeria bacterium]
MKLCAIQIPFTTNETDAALSVRMAIDELNKCDSSCDIILTPEYTNAPASFPVGKCIPFAQAHTDALISAAKNAAVRCNAIVAVNYVCEAEPGLFRNTTEVFDRQGNSAGRFYKQHLPRAEKNVNLLDEEYTRSFRRPDIITVDGIRFGFLICYDTYFSEYVAHIAHRHPDVVFVSSFQRGERKDILRMQNQHLAFNCNCYVLRASVSMGEHAENGGNAMVVSPEGVILGEFGNQCGTFTCEIDDIKHKHMRSNSFGGSMIPNEQFIEQARATWAYRPCGSMTVEGDAKMEYPRLCAHRGFNTIAPENSLAAFGAAIALGAQEIELDVRFTADGIPVVSHDSNLERVSNGSGTIEEHTLAELRELDFGIKHGEHFTGLQIPTLEEVLCKFARHVIINLHIKSEETHDAPEYPEWQMKKIADLLDTYDQQEHVYFMGAPDVMQSAIKYAPHIPRCIGAFPDPWEIIERGIQYKCQKAQLFAPYYNKEMIEKAHANGMRCTFFYCDDPAKVPELLAMGVDTILTNDYLAISMAAKKYLVESKKK